jgi:CheY-like chemotaxis protein
VAEDDAAIRALLSTALREQGIPAWLAADGADALVLFRRHRHEIGAVLLDVRMPRLDGPATLAAVHQIAPHVPCCFMSGFSGEHTEEDLLALGAVRVFEKPFRLQQVLDALQELCGPQPRAPGSGEDGKTL